MANLLNRWLEKAGIKSPDDLSKDERVVYDQWRKVLSEEQEISVDKIKEFCKVQVGIIEARWRGLDRQTYDKSDLIPYHTCYKLILDAIEAPKAEREQLEKHLNQLINQ